MEKEISSEQITELEKLSIKFGWKNLKVYHGGKVTSFEVLSFSPIERGMVEDLGFILSGIQVFSRIDAVTAAVQPFAQISFQIKESES